MIIAVASILLITLGVWLVNRILPFQVCPICAGVSGTWFWMIGARILGYNIDMLVPAVLMGGSVVGLAYQLETKLPPHRSPLLWKSLFIPAGFLAVFYLLLFQWLGFVLVLVILTAIISLFFFVGNYYRSNKTSTDSRVSKLEREMDKCC